jgi:hypothetical protein
MAGESSSYYTKLIKIRKLSKLYSDFLLDPDSDLDDLSRIKMIRELSRLYDQIEEIGSMSLRDSKKPTDDWKYKVQSDFKSVII